MNAREFALDPAAFGLPTREQLVALRIWDLHYHGFIGADSGKALADHAALQFYQERFGIERSFSVDIGGRRDAVLEPAEFDAVGRRILEEQKDRLSGLIRIDPSDPERSVAKMNAWIAEGPCVGIKYVPLGGKTPLRCDHPNNDPIIRRAVELGAVIYIHTWLKVGGDGHRIGGGNLDGESTPADVVTLSRRFPGVPLICGHSGGDWEIGIRTVRAHPDILLEFAGTDANSGAVDLAVRELGVKRLVWGGHGASRSYATELAKVFDADLTFEERQLIFGGNLRRIGARIFRARGYRL